MVDITDNIHNKLFLNNIKNRIKANVLFIFEIYYAFVFMHLFSNDSPYLYNLLRPLSSGHIYSLFTVSFVVITNLY